MEGWSLGLEGAVDLPVFCWGSKTLTSTLGIFKKTMGISGAGKL